MREIVVTSDYESIKCIFWIQVRFFINRVNTVFLNNIFLFFLNNREVTPELIIDIVSEHFNIPISELKGKKRNAEIVLPRQIIMYLCRTLTDTPLKAIGAILGGKDHASVNHGVKKIENELKTDEALNNTVNIIKKKINPI